MDFETFLISKKINSAAFKEGEPKLWQEFKFEFDQLHPKSFTAQKLFLINGIRRRFPVPIQAADEKVIEAKKIKPILRPVQVNQEQEGVKSSKPVMNRPKPIIKSSEQNLPEEIKKPIKPVMKRPKMK